MIEVSDPEAPFFVHRNRLPTTTLGVAGSLPLVFDAGVFGLAIRTLDSGTLGVAKALVSIEPRGRNLFDVTYVLMVENLATYALTGIELEDDLASAFAPAAEFSVLSLTSPRLTVEPSFDGVDRIALLTGTDTLDPGETASLELVVRLDSGGNPGPYFNQASGHAQAPLGRAE